MGETEKNQNEFYVPFCCLLKSFHGLAIGCCVAGQDEMFLTEWWWDDLAVTGMPGEWPQNQKKKHDPNKRVRPKIEPILTDPSERKKSGSRSDSAAKKVVLFIFIQKRFVVSSEQ